MTQLSRPLAFVALVSSLACRHAPARPDQGLARPPLTVAVVDEDLAFAEQQVRKAENRLELDVQPRFTAADFAGGPWVTAPRTDWRSGFFTGLEWLMFESFPDGAHGWQAMAEERTRGFAGEVSRPQTHDIGFKTLGTYGNAYRLTNRDELRAKIFAGANTLAARFLPQHGVTQSWGNQVGSGDLRVIIDNMMNVELFFQAAELTSDAADRERWLGMALSHARTTAKNHVRADGSTCHVYFYNLGVCRTHQGLADGSTWSRGQAWAMHGFTTSYEYARKYPQHRDDAELFLQTAQRTADLYLRRLGEPKNGDWIPLHDFDAPAGSPKDSSAAAVAASALLELSRLPAVPATRRADYRRAAEAMLLDLSRGGGAKPYRETAAPSDLAKETVLLRATTTYRGPGHPSNADVERGLVYADYYFVEALLRWRDLYGPTPKAPAFLTAAAGPAGVALSWMPTRGAASYTVKRRSAGGAYVAVHTGTEPSYVDTSAPAGSDYVVTATNQIVVESAPSNELHATASGR
jgi:unsaturated chondroitin disaccharide hydrolase